MRVLKDHVHSGHMAGTEHPWTPSLPNTDPRRQPERTGVPLSPSVFFQHSALRNLNIVLMVGRNAQRISHPLAQSMYGDKRQHTDKGHRGSSKLVMLLCNGPNPVFPRTFHLVSNPDLVLAVSMTKAGDEVCGYPVIAQVRYVEAKE